MTDTLTLTAEQKRDLKAQAHGLDPVVMIGDKGLTANVLGEIDLSLTKHGLIKVRVAGDDREARLAYATAIVEHTQCALVQHIGKLLVLYRPRPESELARDAAKAKPALRKPKRTTKRAFNSKG